MKKLSIMQKTVIQSLLTSTYIACSLWSILKSTNKTILVILFVSCIISYLIAFSKKCEKLDERDNQLFYKAEDKAGYSIFLILIPLLVLSFTKPNISFSYFQVCLLVSLVLFLHDLFRKIFFIFYETRGN